MEINKIIACGDSFTAGDELLGDELVSGYSKLANNGGETKKRNKAFRNYGQEIKKMSFDKQQEFFERSKEKTWANKFAKSAGIPIFNIADRGLSNQEIAHRTLVTVKKELNKNTDTDKLLVLLMITHPLRFGNPISKDSKYSNEWNFETLHFDINSYAKESYKPKREFGKYIFINYDYYNLFWQSYCSLIGLFKYLEHKKIKYYIFDSSLWSWGINNQSTYHKDDFRYGITHDLGEIVNPLYRLSDHKVHNHSLPGHHYIEEVHDLFSKKIKTELFNDIRYSS
jgi:hypothetical protein